MGGCFHLSKSGRLACMLTLTASFCLLELISGYATNSMALVADAFHMISDVLALLIAFFSVRIAKRKTTKNTFGWARAEVLGAMINSIFLCALCCSILVEAIKRMLSVEDINDPKQILIVGGCGLIVNIIGMWLFHGQMGQDHHYHPPARIGEDQNLEQLAADEGLRESATEFMPPPVFVRRRKRLSTTQEEEEDDDDDEYVYDDDDEDEEEENDRSLQTPKTDSKHSEMIINTSKTIVTTFKPRNSHTTNDKTHQQHATPVSVQNFAEKHSRPGILHEIDGVIAVDDSKKVVIDTENEEKSSIRRSLHANDANREHATREKKFPNNNSSIKNVDSVAAAAAGDKRNLIVEKSEKKSEQKSEKKSAGHHHHHHGSGGQLNMRAAFLHVMGDALGSVIVIISALIIWLTDWPYRFYIDPVMSGILVFIIICTTIPVLKESALILLQTAPKTLIHLDEMKKLLLQEFEPQIVSIHELHVWQLAGDKVIASAHLQFRALKDYMRIAKRLKRFFHQQGVHSITLQPEILIDDDDERGYDELDDVDDTMSRSIKIE